MADKNSREEVILAMRSSVINSLTQDILALTPFVVDSYEHCSVVKDTLKTVIDRVYNGKDSSEQESVKTS